MDRIPVLGVGFDNLTCEEALARCLEIAEHAKGYVVTPNPEIVYRCRKDPVANRVVNGGSLVIPDGIGVIYGAKILGTPIKARIPGIDLACALMQQMNQSGLKLFLLGAKPGIAQKAADNLRITYPNLQIVGTHDGYFQDDTPVIQAINAVKPDVLFVCLGSPRQEQWTSDHLGELDVHLCMCLGGSLDVFSGTVERAPSFYRKCGLEWLYRLFQQPSRFGRMTVLPKFLLLALKERICPSCSK